MHKIITKEDLKAYLEADSKRFGRKITIKDMMLGNDDWHFFLYFRHLRMLEYHLNNRHRIQTFIWTIIHKIDCNRLHLNTYPNTIGPGIRFYHIGNFSEIYPNAEVGANCTFLSGSVIGNKGMKLDPKCKTIIGDNCYFGLNSFAGGNIRIGNNVTIGTNAVVTHDIPDNAIVGGVPAHVIRIKSENENNNKF